MLLRALRTARRQGDTCVRRIGAASLQVEASVQPAHPRAAQHLGASERRRNGANQDAGWCCGVSACVSHPPVLRASLRLLSVTSARCEAIFGRHRSRCCVSVARAPAPRPHLPQLRPGTGVCCA